MSAFSQAFTIFFAALGMFFKTFESLANTANNLATVAEESSGAYKDQARIERQAKIAALNKEHGTTVAITQ